MYGRLNLAMPVLVLCCSGSSVLFPVYLSVHVVEPFLKRRDRFYEVLGLVPTEY